ncbi:MAG: NAD-dependent epimerase/dehydratase family protein, partial [Flavobacteriaceae bacterium]|nr:NAD-dependent epimerase/dehydratase family protein [Flavobacteriaceae bacterium]
EIWGSGKPMREFLWSEDMADACVYLMETIDFKDIVEKETAKTDQRKNSPPSGGDVRFKRTEGANNQQPTGAFHINIGTGQEVSIKELAETIKEIIGFTGSFYFNTEKPDGTLRKLTDPSKLNKLGWKYSVNLREGLKRIYSWYQA